jgi:hypothetical protein
MPSYQIIDFINQNIKNGLAENNIKQLLLNDGWTAEQINDGFRLIEFIKHNLKEGFTENQIRQSLLENEWTEEQVNAGFRLYKDPIKVPEKKSSSKILVFLGIILFIILFALTSYFLYEYFKSNSQISNEIQSETSNEIKTNNIPTNTEENEFNQTFEIIKKATIEKNKDVYVQNLTKKTKELVAGGFEPIWYSNMQLIKTEKKGADLIATIKVTHENGREEENEILFIMEDGAWKIATMEQLENIQGSSPEKQPSTTTNGLPDLIVTDVKTHPDPPKINDENTEIEISIKNIGTAPSISGINYTLSIDDSSPVSYSLMDSIAANQSVSSIYKPYNFQFQRTDKSGNKVIKIILNADHAVTESSEDNNIFTKTIIFVD